MISLKVEESDNQTVVFISGMIDSTTADEFAELMQEVLNTNPKILILDFTKIDYISSAGFRVMFMIAKEMKSYGGKPIAQGLAPEIKNLFDMVHLDHVMDIES